MKDDSLPSARSGRVWLTSAHCNLDDFQKIVGRRTSLADYPMANAVASNVLIYEGDGVRAAAKEPESRKAIMAEWVEAMLTGPGIVVFKGAFADTDVIDESSKLFFDIIAEQHRDHTAVGDHFAKPGANDRVWNALEKLCLREPELFARYYANEIIALVSEAWLGTGYQITSALNVVNPGGEAQSAHRDYHMGFQTEQDIERFPAHVHQLSPILTLQGAIAHCDMPVESGPTLYLPFSQDFLPGYFAWRKPEFKAYFKEKCVQLPLAKGDAAFFNPALFHAAGHNRTTHVKRMANLLQVSTIYGRAMEAVDRARMCKAVFPVLRGAGDLTPREVANVVAACADGYSFPTNLDRDPPIGGLAPQTQNQLMSEALAQNWEPDAFAAALDKQAVRRTA